MANVSNGRVDVAPAAGAGSGAGAGANKPLSAAPASSVTAHKDGAFPAPSPSPAPALAPAPASTDTYTVPSGGAIGKVLEVEVEKAVAAAATAASVQASHGAPESEDAPATAPAAAQQGGKEGDGGDEEAPPYHFEGPEKCLELDFYPFASAMETADPRGLRAVTKEEWTAILTAARCTILCSRSNDQLDSYVLSESSLFVYPHKVVIKTCGTTTLLHAVDPVLQAARRVGLGIEWIGYTRKNFEFPHDQEFPHSNFSNEVRWLKKRFPEGHAYVLGPITDDHWFIFVADYITRSSEDARDRTIDIMMFELDPDFTKLFWKSNGLSDKEITVRSGIRDILPTASIQEVMFEPCGYSMNALLFDSYYTIHITPEDHCSYASFETNVRQPTYSALIRNVLSVFRPKRFTITLFADQGGLDEMRHNPLDASKIMCSNATYTLHSQSSTKFEGDYCSFMGNYRLTTTTGVSPKPAKKNRARTASETS